MPAPAGAPLLLGRYALHGEIASGGMATIHLGELRGPAGFARTVAIKRLHTPYAKDPDFVAMFLDEARLAARVQHTNVVSILDVFAADGELFLVMDLVQGATLAQLGRLARERGVRLPTPIVASIVAGALHGLHAAHEAKDDRGVPLGIVHRDVSPQNIMVGVDGVARVLDFGVAKARVRLQSTRDGYLKGKLAYMAPEHISTGQATRLSDVYSAGIVLWEALTAARFVEFESEAELVAKMAAGAVVTPSAHVPDLPRGFDSITLRALERHPARRFPSAREMAIALERTVDVAMASDVGDWLRSFAGEVLERGASQIEALGARAISEVTERAPVPTMPPPSDRANTIVTLSTSPPPREAKARRKILVIDDSETVLDRLGAALRTAGYDVVTTARTVGTARHIAGCDLAILDYHMPGIDGAEVLASLRAAAAASASARECLFFLYTSDPEIAQRHKELGFDGVFTRKGDDEALARQVRAVLQTLDVRAITKRPRPA
jgi:serine/threonine-protein kinase